MSGTKARVRFGRGGLLPAVVQDRASGRVLMLAYMDRRALRATLASGHSVFWSRSRRRLWKKGETSGNVQRVRAVAADCDGDALLVQVDPAGPACHTGRTSCFFGSLKGRLAVPTGMVAEDGSARRAVKIRARRGSHDSAPRGAGAVLEELDALIRARRVSAPAGSYTGRLFNAGLDRILRKVGEEATEVVVAAKNPDRRALAEETADLLYHLLVLLAECGAGLQAVAKVLKQRRKEAR
jgi:phosphoribosyl-ATP pyrophosphohydrolase/phosphoribosyl-AMP cyclohydrolase